MFILFLLLTFTFVIELVSIFNVTFISILTSEVIGFSSFPLLRLTIFILVIIDAITIFTLLISIEVELFIITTSFILLSSFLIIMLFAEFNTFVLTFLIIVMLSIFTI